MRSILLNYSEPMHRSYPHSFHYDNNRKLNVITDDNGMTIPFVESRFDRRSLSTKTDVFGESDDMANEMLLISTKTRQEMESDDAGFVIYK